MSDPRTLLAANSFASICDSPAPHVGCGYQPVRRLRRACRRQGRQKSSPLKANFKAVHLMLAVQADGCEVVTSRRTRKRRRGCHPMQAAFRGTPHRAADAADCTPGMIMTAVDMVNRLGSDSRRATIRHELEGKYLPLHRLSQHRPRGERPGEKAMTEGGARPGCQVPLAGEGGMARFSTQPARVAGSVPRRRKDVRVSPSTPLLYPVPGRA